MYISLLSLTFILISAALSYIGSLALLRFVPGKHFLGHGLKASQLFDKVLKVASKATLVYFQSDYYVEDPMKR